MSASFWYEFNIKLKCFDTDFLGVFFDGLWHLKWSIGGSAPKFIKNLTFRNHALWIYKGWVWSVPGVDWSHFGSVVSCLCNRFLMLSYIFWSIGVGVGVGGGTQLPKSHFSVPKPFQYHNLWPARCGLALQFWSARGRNHRACLGAEVGCLPALASLHSPCTCLSALALCTSLFALHSVLTPHWLS